MRLPVDVCSNDVRIINAAKLRKKLYLKVECFKYIYRKNELENIMHQTFQHNVFLTLTPPHVYFSPSHS